MMTSLSYFFVFCCFVVYVNAVDIDSNEDILSNSLERKQIPFYNGNTLIESPTDWWKKETELHEKQKRLTSIIEKLSEKIPYLRKRKIPHFRRSVEDDEKWSEEKSLPYFRRSIESEESDLPYFRRSTELNELPFFRRTTADIPFLQRSVEELPYFRRSTEDMDDLPYFRRSTENTEELPHFRRGTEGMEKLPYFRRSIENSNDVNKNAGLPYFRRDVSELPYFKRSINLPYFRRSENLPYFRRDAELPYFRRNANIPHFRRSAKLPYFKRTTNDQYNDIPLLLRDAIDSTTKEHEQRGIKPTKRMWYMNRWGKEYHKDRLDSADDTNKQVQDAITDVMKWLNQKKREEQSTTKRDHQKYKKPHWIMNRWGDSKKEDQKKVAENTVEKKSSDEKKATETM